ncbi:hypothetical protein REPUB_Repub13aG0161200 [Reevesia pubescens]
MGNIFSISLSCDTIISRCWDCAAGQAIYTCQLEENFDDLKTALEELKERRNDVMRKVNIAEQQNLKPLDEVRGWLSRAGTLMNEVDVLLLDGPQVIKKLCMGGCCCSKNYKSTLNFSKIVAKRLLDVKDLKAKGAFEEVATAVPTASVVERPSESFIGLESVFDKVWSNLEEKDGKVIGIYGTGGIGKTRLLTEINNNLGVIPCGFDVVIWVVVSKVVNIGKIQDTIGKRIGLYRMWKDNSTPEDEKSTDIYNSLRGNKFVLLLDDIWKPLDLSKVGIPIPTQENGSKIIFTTRFVGVCGQMGADEKIRVKCLPEDKAWKLFQEKVGEDTLDCHPNILELAQEVAKECGGLPLALITIGCAMACKNRPEEWKYAIEVLKRSANFVFPNMGEEVYPLLKFSYDSLPNDMVRSCLLYCSLFSEDHTIPKERLIDCWIGEGFLVDHDSISQARNQGHFIIGSLIHACLLEEAGDWEIKMHDVIRDMSLWIACTYEAEKWKFFVQAGYQLTKVPDVGKWRGIRRMSLMQNKIEHLTEAPNCPDLQTLFLNWNQLKVIHDEFFQFMTRLKVLSLRRNEGITELPVGISTLVSLEYLDLSRTRIRHVPIELKALEKLKCLKLECIYTRITISRGLISGLSKLQILRMICSYPFDEEAGEDNNECLAEELQCLNHLNALTVSVTSAFALDRFLSAERLQSCTEQIGLQSFRDSKELNILSLANIKSLNYIQLRECESLEEVKTEWEGEGRMMKARTEIQIPVSVSQPSFQSLLTVTISKCSKLRDATWLILAPNLRNFSVIDCDKMKEIINEIKLGQVAEEFVGTSIPFAKLKYVYFQNLPELESIYWDALPLPCMKEINVEECPKLRRLPLNSNNAKGNKIIILGKEKWWKELQWEDESTRNAFLPCFIAF